MDKNIEQIRQASPEVADNEEVKVLSKELDISQDLKAILDSERGHVLVDFLNERVATNLRSILFTDYSQNHIGLLAKIAEAKSSLSLLVELKSSGESMNNIQEELDNLVKELADNRY